VIEFIDIAFRIEHVEGLCTRGAILSLGSN